MVETVSTTRRATWLQPSPLGPLVVTTTARGLRSVRFGPAANGDLAGAGRQAGGEPDGWGERDGVVAAALDAYFAGDLGVLDDLPVDLEGRASFALAVLVALRRVRAPELTTYGRLAAAVGRPGGARAVGQAVARNPVPVVVPCHRVVAGDGSLGGYAGGAEVKRWLLAHEGHGAAGAGPAGPGAQAGAVSRTSTPRRRR